FETTYFAPAGELPFTNSIAGGSGRRGLRGVDEAVAVAVEFREDRGSSQKLAGGKVAVIVQIHPPKPFRRPGILDRDRSDRRARRRRGDGKPGKIEGVRPSQRKNDLLRKLLHTD